MLTSATEMLRKARDGKYAVGQFNINNLEWTKAILLTAQELNSPVILGVSEGAGKYMTGFETVAAMVAAMDKSLGNKEHERINPDKPITVGDHVWIGCKCVLLKGAEIPNDTVLAAGTQLRSPFAGENQIVGGNPPAILKRDVTWEHE